MPNRLDALQSSRRSQCSSASVRTTWLHRLDASQYSIKLQILSKFSYGKIDATVRTTWILVRTRFSLRQESQFKFNCPDASLPSFRRAINRYRNYGFDLNRPDDCLSWSGRTHSKYGNCMLKNNRPDGHPPWSGHVNPYMEITCSGRKTVRTTLPHRLDAALKQERFSTKISEILDAQLSVRTGQVHRLDGAHLFYSSRPFEPQPINKRL
jgi:hypothetical protein